MLTFESKDVVGAAESVCAILLSVKAASASERVFGVRPDGVLGVDVALLLGSSRRDEEVASPMVNYLWYGSAGFAFC